MGKWAFVITIGFQTIGNTQFFSARFCNAEVGFCHYRSGLFALHLSIFTSDFFECNDTGPKKVGKSPLSKPKSGQKMSLHFYLVFDRIIPLNSTNMPTIRVRILPTKYTKFAMSFFHF